MDLPVSRSDYRLGSLHEEGLLPDPVELLAQWIRDADTAGLPEPSSMCLSTVSAEGRPSSRFVLLRGLDQRGLRFFTNYGSRKAADLATNPFACVAFWWPGLERQVRVEGSVEQVEPEESDAYFYSRPLDSRIASAASPQSQEVPNREALEAMVSDLAARYPEGPPRPPHWGGYRLVPDRFEFWQGRPARLHDRIVYEAAEEGWHIKRLAP